MVTAGNGTVTVTSQNQKKYCRFLLEFHQNKNDWETGQFALFIKKWNKKAFLLVSFALFKFCMDGGTVRVTLFKNWSWYGKQKMLRYDTDTTQNLDFLPYIILSIFIFNISNKSIFLSFFVRNYRGSVWKNLQLLYLLPGESREYNWMFRIKKWAW